MSDYIASCTLEVNSQKVSDFKTVTEGKREIKKQVKLMGKTGFITTTPTYTVTVDYVVPQSGAFDWEKVSGGTLTILKEGGAKVTYTGVSTLEVGESKIDGENEEVQNISLGAIARKEETWKSSQSNS